MIMPQPRVLVLRAPGTNCDVETAYAFELAGAKADRLHVNRILEALRTLNDYNIVCLPGGFSYGDDLAAGRILGTQLKHHLFEPLREFKQAGKLILGICNGFQILMRSGLLLADEAGPAGNQSPATLMLNDSGRYEARWVRLAVAKSPSPFFAGLEHLELPVAHAEGRFVPRDENVLKQLQSNHQVVLRYVGGTNGSAHPAKYPDNPNGAVDDIAGICDQSGLVCGLMPHPERFIDATQHPQWTRRPLASEGAGLAIFKNAVRYFS